MAFKNRRSPGSYLRAALSKTIHQRKVIEVLKADIKLLRGAAIEVKNSCLGRLSADSISHVEVEVATVRRLIEAIHVTSHRKAAK